jgi:hypothetical protein
VNSQSNEKEEVTTKNITTKMSGGQRKRLKRAQKAYQKQFNDYMEYSRRKQVEETKKFKLLKYQVGANIYNNLKKACMVTVPEQKNEAGEVVQKSKTVLDANKFLRELHLAIVVLREARIIEGKRKRTTGRSSNRAYHNSVMSAIKERLDNSVKTEASVDADATPDVEPISE